MAGKYYKTVEEGLEAYERGEIQLGKRGTEEEMLEGLSEKLGITVEEAKKLLDEF